MLQTKVKNQSHKISFHKSLHGTADRFILPALSEYSYIETVLNIWLHIYKMVQLSCTWLCTLCCISQAWSFKSRPMVVKKTWVLNWWSENVWNINKGEILLRQLTITVPFSTLCRVCVWYMCFIGRNRPFLCMVCVYVFCGGVFVGDN